MNYRLIQVPLLVSFFTFLAPKFFYAQFGEVELLASDKLENLYQNTVVDLDNDGDLDVVINEQSSNRNIFWVENLGDEIYSIPKPLQAAIVDPGFVRDVLAADIDSDGDQDIVYCTNSDQGYAIVCLENLGGGMFALPIDIAIYETEVIDIEAADFDDDGDLDLVIAAFYGESYAWYENLGSGVFSQKHVLYENADFAVMVRPADVDNDGDLDIVTWSGGDKVTGWFENLGNDLFSSLIIVQDLESNSFEYVSNPEPVDLDNDGDLDLAAVVVYGDKFAWFENIGGGEFAPQEVVFELEGLKEKPSWNDVDLDGDLDALFRVSEGFQIWKNSGSGDFTHFSTLTIDNEIESFFYLNDFADYNNDGFDDLLLFVVQQSITFSPGKVEWYVNDGLGNFFPDHEVAQGGQYIRSVIADDLDGDGDLDVVYSDYGYDKVVWRERIDAEILKQPVTIALGINENWSLDLSDLDEDGDKDILTTSGLDNTIAWIENLGDGEFSDPYVISTSATSIRHALAADLDGDLDMDVIAGIRGENKVVWYENQGGGVFSDEITITGSTPSSDKVLAVDFDLDGDQDVLCGGSNRVYFHENSGDGTFAEGVSLSYVSSGGIVKSLDVSDLDLDGDMDIVVCGQYSGPMYWLENLGESNFQEHILSTLAHDSHIADVDLDGDGDILAHNDYGLVLFENLGGGTFSTPDSIAPPETPYQSYSDIATGDYNGDGFPEVFTGHRSFISMHENLFRYGCLDNVACNFNPGADISDGSCCYGICGCTDPEAENYDPDADCQQEGSCDYRICGYVYFDENTNGIWDSTEYALPNQTVHVEPIGSGITDDYGKFSFYNLSQEVYSFQVETDAEYPYATTENPVDISVDWSGEIEDVNFGVSIQLNEFGVDVDLYSQEFQYPCDEWVMHNMYFRNVGNTPMYGVVRLNYAEEFQDYLEVSPIDSVIGTSIYLSFDSLMPGELRSYDVLLKTPDYNYIASYLYSHLYVYGYHEGEQIAENQTTLSALVACAYDPNDKQAIPIGYEEPHFIENEEEIEYLIRFQNTGNAPATNVLVTDTIDESLDLNTLVLVANSHSVMTTFRESERIVEFYFENIMLPDSNCCEQDSHGFISYSISPYPDLAHGTEINNSANIYFDNNPPIITNTTWHTIYVCPEYLAEVVGADALVCAGDEISLSSSESQYIESFEWYLNDELISSEQEIQFTLPEEDVTLTLKTANPLCETSHSVQINAALVFTVSGDLDLCPGESTILEIEGGADYTWNGEVGGATQEFTPDETIDVLVGASVGENCLVTDTITIHVHEPEVEAGEDQVQCGSIITTLTASGGASYTWNGELVGESIEVSPTETTIYEVIGMDEYGCEDSDQVTVVYDPLLLYAGDDSEICEGDSVMLVAMGAESYLWEDEYAGSELWVFPELTTTYTVAGTTFLGCTFTDDVTVSFPVGPIIEIEIVDLACVGQEFTLFATGAENYVWNNGSEEASITDAIWEMTTFQVSGSDGCVTNSTEVTLSPLDGPILMISNDVSICPGETASLSASGAINYQWNGVFGPPSVDVTPEETTVYEIIGFGSNGCQTADSISVFVDHSQVDLGPDLEVCFGDSLTLVAEGSTSYIWEQGFQGSEYDFLATESLELTAVGTSLYECLTYDSIVVTVNSLPEVFIDDVDPICLGMSTTLSSSGALTYVWNDLSEGEQLIVSPEETSTFSVTGTDGNGCANGADIEVVVNPVPEAIFLVEGNILTSEDAASYQWYLEGELIDGATSQTYLIEVDGYYSLEVTNEWGCSAISLEQLVLITSTREFDNNAISVYPNPSSGFISLSLPIGVFDILIFDAAGKIVFSEYNVSTNQLSLDLSGAALGSYMVKVMQGDSLIGKERFIIK